MPISDTIWFFTFGLLGIGWLIDLFLTIYGPSTNRSANATWPVRAACEGSAIVVNEDVLEPLLAITGWAGRGLAKKEPWGRPAFRHKESIVHGPDRQWIAQQALGHNSKAVHAAYSRNAEVTVPSLDDWEKQWRKGEMQKPKLVPVDFQAHVGEAAAAPDAAMSPG